MLIRFFRCRVIRGEGWERAEPDVARSAVELLQEFAESQGPRGEPWHIGGEPWCGGPWEDAADGAEDVGR